ncbi:MAG: DNA methyltransferase [Candidatus Heimdallarchaeaceae archaeon]
MGIKREEVEMDLIFEENKIEVEEKEIEDSAAFELETTTIWSFPDRGSWASHKGDYRGNFAPQIPRNVILRYSKKGELVLDPMVGSGTTLIEAKLLHRKGIGIDINEKPLQIAQSRIENTQPPKGNVDIKLYHGDARNMNKIEDESIDLICTHPPYLNIIKYSENNPNDLSRTGSVKYFISDIKEIADECFRVLKPNKILAILIGDTRKSRHYVPLSLYVLKTFLDSNFLLMEDIIKHQWNCTSTPRWRKQSLKYNFHLIMHEHLYIFRKPEKGENLSKYKYSSNLNGII